MKKRWHTRSGYRNHMADTKDPRKEIGRRGEELALAFLLTKGFFLVEKNWRCKVGELDLIVRREDETRFVEVKTRFSLTYGYPEEAVTHTKRQHLAKAIEWWLHTHPMPKHYQLDVISILVLPGQKPDITWIEGI